MTSHPRRATHWRLRTTTVRFGQLPAIMGIVNVTPDSFSDGGRLDGADAAVAHALKLIAEGAAIIDIGGESTRPHALPVSEAEELERALPVVAGLASCTDVPISIDTSKAAVAKAALDAGAEIINDVTGFAGDPAMVDVALESGAGLCVMHMAGTPRTMQDDPAYVDVVADISHYLGERRAALIEAGVAADRICVDPGIGFGKTVSHNIELLRAAERFHALGAPVLFGHSRKSFLGTVLQDIHLERDHATAGVATALARRGVQVLRVHDVAATTRALAAFAAAGGLDD